jgi:Tfp pilus assembly protein FimT
MIEMLCVVVIMAIAAAIVYAGMSNQGYIQAKSAARNIVSDLLLAQNIAISTQAPVYVKFNTTGASVGGINGNTYGLCTAISPSAIFLINPLTQQAYTNTWSNQDWSIQSVSFGGQTYMDFSALGVPESTPGTNIAASSTIVVNSNGYTSTITIQANTGDITVQ